MEYEPVEWIPGNPSWARRFTWIEVASIVFSAVFPLLLVWESYWGLGAWAGFLLGIPTIVLLLIPVAVAVPAILVSYIPRWYPVVRRLGISPAHLRIESSFRTLKKPWNRVAWWDPTRIEVSLPLGSLRFLLTDAQAGRLHAFLQRYQPLPGSPLPSRTRPLSPTFKIVQAAPAAAERPREQSRDRRP